MMSRPTPRALAALVGLIAVLLLAAPPAGAHGGEGEMEVTSVTRDGADVTVAVRLIFVDDGHGVPDATVTVVVDEGTPVPMDPGATEGDYEATVTAPAGAAIRVTSVEPATTAEAVAPEEDEAPTTTASTTTAPPETDDDDQAPATTEDEADDTTTPSDDEADDSDDGGVNPVVIGAIVAVVAAAGAMAAILLWKRPDETAGSDDRDGTP